MATNFFELVNDKFFSPFTSQNKQLNYDLLHLINSKMHNEMKLFPRNEVMSWLEEYLENCPFVFIDDESGEDEGHDIKLIASNKLRYFVSCGWLIDENDNKTLKTTYQMDSNAILILNVMEEIVNNDTKPMEYTGYVYSIYSSLQRFDFNHATDIVQQMRTNTQDLMDRLRGLNVHIKKYLKTLLADDKLTPRDILSQLLVEYQDKVILRTFDNLRVKDNPSRYKSFILEKIDELSTEKNMERLISDYINKKKNGVQMDESIVEAKAFFYESFDYVAEQFQSIEESLDSLNARNTKYVSAAQSRLNFLLNEEVDIEGKIVELLRNIADTNDYIDEESPFGLFEVGKIDEYSLFTPRSSKRKPNSQIADQEEIENDFDDKTARKKLLAEIPYTCKEIDKFVLQKMDRKKRIQASELTIENGVDLIKLFMATLYSGNKMVSYKVTYTDTTFTCMNKKMSDFIIERK